MNSSFFKHFVSPASESNQLSSNLDVYEPNYPLTIILKDVNIPCIFLALCITVPVLSPSDMLESAFHWLSLPYAVRIGSAHAYTFANKRIPARTQARDKSRERLKIASEKFKYAKANAFIFSPQPSS